MWDLIVSVPDHRLSFYSASLMKIQSQLKALLIEQGQIWASSPLKGK